MPEKIIKNIWTGEINKRIDTLMQLQGKNNEVVAKGMNTNPANISRIRNNKFRFPSPA